MTDPLIDAAVDGRIDGMIHTTQTVSIGSAVWSFRFGDTLRRNGRNTIRQVLEQCEPSAGGGRDRERVSRGGTMSQLAVIPRPVTLRSGNGHLQVGADTQLLADAGKHRPPSNSRTCCPPWRAGRVRSSSTRAGRLATASC